MFCCILSHQIARFNVHLPWNGHFPIFFLNSDNHSKKHRLVLFLILLLKLFCSAYGSGKMLGISHMAINSNLHGRCHDCPKCWELHFILAITVVHELQRLHRTVASKNCFSYLRCFVVYHIHPLNPNHCLEMGTFPLGSAPWGAVLFPKLAWMEGSPNHVYHPHFDCSLKQC